MRLLLRSKTPWAVKFTKLPLIVAYFFCRSVVNSLKIFFSEGGSLLPDWTEKLKPWAWFLAWYGSWPKIITLTVLNGANLNALNIKFFGGKSPFLIFLHLLKTLPIF